MYFLGAAMYKFPGDGEKRGSVSKREFTVADDRPRNTTAILWADPLRGLKKFFRSPERNAYTLRINTDNPAGGTCP